ncbi:MAG: hypothetical protein ACRDJG_11820 [Actinomycetota bacterium]
MGNDMGTRAEHLQRPGADPGPDGRPPGAPVERSGAQKSWGRLARQVATGSGVGGTVLWAMARRIRRKRRERHEPEPAAGSATVVQLIPDRWALALSDGRWKGPAAGLGAAWLLLRWTELRRLKRLTRALIKSR